MLRLPSKSSLRHIIAQPRVSSTFLNSLSAVRQQKLPLILAQPKLATNYSTAPRAAATRRTRFNLPFLFVGIVLGTLLARWITAKKRQPSTADSEPSTAVARVEQLHDETDTTWTRDFEALNAIWQTYDQRFKAAQLELDTIRAVLKNRSDTHQHPVDLHKMLAVADQSIRDTYELVEKQRRMYGMIQELSAGERKEAEMRRFVAEYSTWLNKDVPKLLNTFESSFVAIKNHLTATQE